MLLEFKATFSASDQGQRTLTVCWTRNSRCSLFLNCIVTMFCSHYRYDLTVEEAIELGKRAITHAAHRDAMSGGMNNGDFFCF